MDFSRSPEDNTSVIKMMDGLYSFLGQSNLRKSHQRSRHPVSQNNSSCSFNSVLTNDSLVGVSTLSQHKRTRDSLEYSTLSRDEKAELIAAKSKVAKLEDELITVKSKEQENLIEEETKRKKTSGALLNKQEECDSFHRKFRQVLEEKQQLEDEVAELKKKYDVIVSSHLAEKKSWQLERSKLSVSSDKINDTHVQLKEKLYRQSVEFSLCKTKLEEAEVQLNTYQSRVNEAKRLVRDYSEVKHRCDLAEHTVKELQEKIARVDESALIQQRSQVELAKFRELQRDNLKLKEDNELYRNSAENALILKEQISSLEAKLKKSEITVEHLNKVELENQTLMTKMQRWECSHIFGEKTKARSPEELTRVIAELQKSQMLMATKEGELETSVFIKDEVLKTKTKECSNLLEASLNLQMKNDQLEDQYQKLLRRFTLVSSDRDGLRRVLSSYENEETDSPARVRLIEAEEKLCVCNQQISQLEEDLHRSNEEASIQKTLRQKLEQEHENLKMELASSSAVIKETAQVQDCRKQLKDLEEKFVKVKEEKDILQIRLDRRELQGEYDPFKTKVLHLNNNPLHLARAKYLRDLEHVHEENEKLRKKLFEVQQQQQRQTDEDESMNVSKLIKTSKPMADALKRLEAEQLKRQRLEEQFTKTAKEYREAVYNIFGYIFKAVKTDTYRVQSIYSEKPDDYFLFTCAKNKEGVSETGMIETSYARQWMDSIRDYLQDGDSIPGLLATVTLELFSRTTQIKDLTLAKKARQLET